MMARYLDIGETYVDSSTTTPISKTVVIQQKHGYIIQTITQGSAHSLFIPGETFQRHG